MRSKLRPLLVAVAALAGCSKERICPADEMLCEVICTAVLTDPANCGACGHACAVGETCSGGLCQCGGGRVDCGGGADACVDLESDPGNCGSCGATCDTSQVCTTPPGGATACADTCSFGLVECGRACVDTATDAFHCGACGRTCGTNEHCRAGLCLADLYLACFNTGEVREASRALDPAGIPLLTDFGPVRMTWLGDALYVANSTSNTISEVRFDPPAVRSTYGQSSIQIPSQGNYADLEFIESHAGLLYVSNASVGTLVIIDPTTRTIIDEIALAAAPTDFPNPQGVTFLTRASAPTDAAYVALNSMNQVAVLDVSGEAGCPSPPCGQVVKRIDVQSLASPGGQAQPARLLVHGSRLFVTLWNLDTSGFLWKPAGSGRLAVIDTATNELDSTVSSGGVTGLVDLGEDCKNPADLAILGDVLYVTCGAFDYSTPAPTIQGGGIVPVDLSGAAPVVNAVVPVAAAEAPGKLAFCNGVGYAGDRNSGQVLRFDPVSGQVTQRATLCPPANGYAYVADITCAR